MTTTRNEPLRTEPVPSPPHPVRPRSRRRLRRALMLLGLVPLLATLLLGLKVAIMLQSNQTGRDDFGAGRYDEAAGAFRDSQVVNVLEPWVASYDLGTTLYLQGEYDAARLQLEAARDVAPGDQQCRVRVNLALADEALGDGQLADGNLAAAQQSWFYARVELRTKKCTTSASSPAVVVSAATSTTARLTNKLSTAVAPTREQPAQPEDSQSDTSDLDQRNRLAEEERERAEQDRDAQDDESPSSGAPVYQW